jgi:hypothetical protein
MYYVQYGVLDTSCGSWYGQRGMLQPQAAGGVAPAAVRRQACQLSEPNY